MTSKILFELREIYRFRWLVFAMVSSTLRMRYRRSVLGFGWSMIGPMLNYLILGLVLMYSGRVERGPDLISYILFGSVAFNFISVGFNQGAQSLIYNEHYIKKIYLPKLLFPLNTVLMEFVNFLLQLVAITAVLMAWGHSFPGWAIFALPPAVVAVFAFTLGLAILGSVLTVYFRDLMHLVPICMQAAFFLTPIVYPLAQAPEAVRVVSVYNPFFLFVEMIREPLSGHFPAVDLVAKSLVVALVVLGAGLVTLKLSDNRIVFRL